MRLGKTYTCKNCGGSLRKGYDDIRTGYTHSNGEKQCPIVVTYAEPKESK